MPLIGQIRLASPGRVELAQDSFWLPRRLVGHGTLFLLKVKGDSMTGAAIADDAAILGKVVAVVRPAGPAPSRRG